MAPGRLGRVFNWKQLSERHPGKVPLAPAPVTELYQQSHISFIHRLSFSKQAASWKDSNLCSARRKICSFLLGRGDYTGEQAGDGKKAARTIESPEYQLLPLLLPAYLPFAVASLPLPHIYGSIEAALQGGDWQKRPIPPANQPPDFQGLRAALMSFQPRGDASREDAGDGG